jgi:hypothetical protein
MMSLLGRNQRAARMGVPFIKAHGLKLRVCRLSGSGQLFSMPMFSIRTESSQRRID